ncbi:MAG: hypothetical protein R2873_14990 [Caldilineaceae bacterium]
MRDSLRSSEESAGFDGSFLPLYRPIGGETVISAAHPSPGTATIPGVDWVQIELRSTADPATVARRWPVLYGAMVM